MPRSVASTVYCSAISTVSVAATVSVERVKVAVVVLNCCPFDLDCLGWLSSKLLPFIFD